MNEQLNADYKQRADLANKEISESLNKNELAFAWMLTPDNWLSNLLKKFIKVKITPVLKDLKVGTLEPEQATQPELQTNV